jgi:hypothetical protein
MSGIFADHLAAQAGARTRLEKAVVAKARREVLKHYKPGDQVEVYGNVGIVQPDGSIRTKYTKVRNGFERGTPVRLGVEPQPVSKRKPSAVVKAETARRLRGVRSGV